MCFGRLIWRIGRGDAEGHNAVLRLLPQLV